MTEHGSHGGHATSSAPNERKSEGHDHQLGTCGGKLKIIASIEEPEVIAKNLAHLEKTAPDQYQGELPLGARAPPGQASLL